MSKLLIKNANMVLENRLFKGDILINNGIIEKISESIEDNSYEIIDAKDNTLIPGFIDVHIHGANGADAMDGTVEALDTISKYVATKGTTNFLATTLTSNKENLLHVLKTVEKVQNKELSGANIFGVHMEGPFFDVEYKGAQNPKYMLSPNLVDAKDYVAVKEGLIKLVALSPRGEQSSEVIKYLVANGIVVSVGHSSASFDDILQAVKDGLSHATHVFNGMRPFTHRDPGVAGAVLASDDITAEVIFDKIHVHPEAVRILLKAKGTDKVICITDAMSATGLPCGNYKLGELDVYVKDNQVRLVEGDSLAGSILTMDKAFVNLLELGYGIVDAVKLTSTNVAKEFALNTGKICEGKDADFALLDSNNNVLKTIVKGKVKYSA